MLAGAKRNHYFGVKILDLGDLGDLEMEQDDGKAETLADQPAPTRIGGCRRAFGGSQRRGVMITAGFAIDALEPEIVLPATFAVDLFGPTEPHLKQASTPTRSATSLRGWAIAGARRTARRPAQGVVAPEAGQPGTIVQSTPSGWPRPREGRARPGLTPLGRDGP